MGIKRPARALRCRSKRVHSAPDATALARAAANAVYSSSPYHCRGSKGQAPIVRAKPASICPRQWSDHEATEALRAALARGSVSEAWEDDFPRYIWHRDGNVVYEARHTGGTPGTFHAYPIEDIQIPRGLI